MALWHPDNAVLYGRALDMKLALAGLRFRLEAMERRRLAGHALHDWQIGDALAEIDRALGPAEPAPAHRDTPKRMARVDALAALSRHTTAAE